jgi:hypothetical protein
MSQEQLKKQKEMLEELEPDQLRKVALQYFQQIQQMSQMIQEMKQEIEEKIVSYWSWDKIRVQYNAINDISKAPAFLYNVLREKAICKDQRCPAFSDLNLINKKLFNLEKEYGKIYTLEEARDKFTFERRKLKEWEKQFWNIKYALMNVLDDICQIGIPNDTKKSSYREERELAHERSLKKIEFMGKHGVNYQAQVGSEVDRDIQKDEAVLYPNDPDYNEDRDIFNREKFEEIVRKKQMKEKQSEDA